MKRTLSGITSLFLCLFMVMTSLSSCGVDHFYKAEITVQDTQGEAIEGATVTLTVDVNADDTLPDAQTTNAEGKVYFSFDNVAIVKVTAQKGDATAESMLTIVEDKTQSLTLFVRDRD